ncbi:MAG: TIGR02996 domain-containing protein [Gemmataceae bacterium]|nr:TIGR02996 domain-containing protein [Gemmataceae bacterium]
MRAPPHIRPARPELRVFLEDIRDEPGEDGVRLILADWLEDTGDEGDAARAELIRLQVALSRPACPRAGVLRRREAALIAEWADDWLGPLASLSPGWHFERGMLRLSLRAVTCFDRRVEEVAQTEAWAWAESLVLLDATPGVVGQLVQLPLLSGLRELSFQDGRVGNNGLQLLASAPALARLRVLNLSASGIGGPGLSSLRMPDALPGLRSLDLSRNHLADADLVPLLLTPVLPRLRELALGHNNLGDGAAALLAQSPLLDGLESLDLRANRSMSLAPLAACGRLGRLRRLDLSQARCAPPALEELARSLPALEELHLDRCELRDDGAKALLRGDGLPMLRTLSLGRNLLGDEGAIALGSGRARPWRAAQLANNFIGPRGAEGLADAEALARLEELGLDNNTIGDDGARSLAWSRNLGRLRLLDVGRNGLTEEGKDALRRRFGKAVLLA